MLDSIHLQSFDCKNKIKSNFQTPVQTNLLKKINLLQPRKLLSSHPWTAAPLFIGRCGAKPQTADRFHSHSDIRYVAAVHRATGLVRLAARVCPAVFLHVYRGLWGATKGQLEPLPRPHTPFSLHQLKLCHHCFPTELIRSQLFSCPGVKFLPVSPLNQKPLPSPQLPATPAPVEKCCLPAMR